MIGVEDPKIATERWLLCFDVSTTRCVVALGRLNSGGEQPPFAHTEAERPNQVSERLVPIICDLVSSAGIRMDDIGVIGCGCGPGTFTGTRVAVATAKGLAFGLGCSVAPVGTLSAMAASGFDRGGDVPEQTIVAILDARRGEVYGAGFRVSADRVRLLGAPRCATLAALIHDLDAQSVVPTRIIGSGVGPYREQIPEALLSSAVACEGPTAAGLWHSSVAALLEGPALPPERLQAIYLRRSYAEMGIHRPKRTWPKSPFV